MLFTALVRQEIVDETDRATGGTKQISSVPIYLSIYSPNGKDIMVIRQLGLYCYMLLYNISTVQFQSCGIFKLPFFSFSYQGNFHFV
jgi:hypothetical protein